MFFDFHIQVFYILNQIFLFRKCLLKIQYKMGKTIKQCWYIHPQLGEGWQRDKETHMIVIPCDRQKFIPEAIPVRSLVIRRM